MKNYILYVEIDAFPSDIIQLPEECPYISKGIADVLSLLLSSFLKKGNFACASISTLNFKVSLSQSRAYFRVKLVLVQKRSNHAC